MAFMPQFVHPEKGQVWLQFLMLGVITIIFACAWFCCVAAAVHLAGPKIRENRTFWQMQEKVTGCILVALGLRLALKKRAQWCQRPLSSQAGGAEGDRFEHKRCFSLRPSREIFEVSTPAASDVVLRPMVGSKRKSTVYGLNGHRAYFLIHLSVGTCGHVIWKSRRFTALFLVDPDSEAS